MPTWAFGLLFLAFVAVSAGVMAGALWVSARAARVRPKPVAYVIVIAAILGVGIVMVLLDPSSLHPAALLGLSVASLVLPFLLIKVVFKPGWWRAALAGVCFLVLNTGAQLALVFGLQRTVMGAFRVPMGAMAPTIEPGDRVLADFISTPRRWDVVIFRNPADPQVVFIKRLVGLPGETVEIVDGEVRINGSVSPKPAELDWLKYDGTLRTRGVSHGGTGSPLTLGTNEFYMLGDKTANSFDSRFWEASPGHQAGALPRENIIGVVQLRYGPTRRIRAFR